MTEDGGPEAPAASLRPNAREPNQADGRCAIFSAERSALRRGRTDRFCVPACRLTQDEAGGNVRNVRVWVSSREAAEIRTWAVEKGWLELADRFYRAERRKESFLRKPPLLWRWRAAHPVLLQCLYCEHVEAFARHRDAKREGWERWPQGGKAWARVLALPQTQMSLDASNDTEELRIVVGGWIHADCVAEWEKLAANIDKERNDARRGPTGGEPR